MFLFLAFITNSVPVLFSASPLLIWAGLLSLNGHHPPEWESVGANPSPYLGNLSAQEPACWRPTQCLHYCACDGSHILGWLTDGLFHVLCLQAWVRASCLRLPQKILPDTSFGEAFFIGGSSENTCPAWSASCPWSMTSMTDSMRRQSQLCAPCQKYRHQGETEWGRKWGQQLAQVNEESGSGKRCKCLWEGESDRDAWKKKTKRRTWVKTSEISKKTQGIHRCLATGYMVCSQLNLYINLLFKSCVDLFPILIFSWCKLKF